MVEGVRHLLRAVLGEGFARVALNHTPTRRLTLAARPGLTKEYLQSGIRWS
jgi:hypothetical protein